MVFAGSRLGGDDSGASVAYQAAGGLMGEDALYLDKAHGPGFDLWRSVYDGAGAPRRALGSRNGPGRDRRPSPCPGVAAL